MPMPTIEVVDQAESGKLATQYFTVLDKLMFVLMPIAVA